MALTLNEKVAIVTGASRGIGAGVAWELACRGANVRAKVPMILWSRELTLFR